MLLPVILLLAVALRGLVLLVMMVLFVQVVVLQALLFLPLQVVAVNGALQQLVVLMLAVVFS